MPYASTTSVSIDRTKTEIDATLRAYGATRFMSGWDSDNNTAFVNFCCRDRLIRFVVPMPRPDEKRFTHTGGRGRRRSATQAAVEHSQAERATWRRLLLCIRAKLESVEAKIETFEEAFLAQIVIPNGETMGQWAKDHLSDVYKLGRMPSLPALPPHEDNP